MHHVSNPSIEREAGRLTNLSNAAVDHSFPRTKSGWWWEYIITVASGAAASAAGGGNCAVLVSMRSEMIGADTGECDINAHNAESGISELSAEVGDTDRETPADADTNSQIVCYLR
mmetsp:Transcript_19712/g.42833  ORF Transcript_19712/g.42833 Transcript_19712/m.42833 type:complete len:116 (+) Transcript_19712:819-1166(+)